MKKGIISILSATLGVIAGVGAVTYQKVKQHEKETFIIKKNEAILKMFNQWIALKQQGKSIADYLEEKGYQRVAIYGMSYAGERLLDDLLGSNIEISYAIDQNANNIFADIELVTKSDISTQPPVDAIIVTAISFFDDIEEEISELIKCPIISLEDIIYEL